MARKRKFHAGESDTKSRDTIRTLFQKVGYKNEGERISEKIVIVKIPSSWKFSQWPEQYTQPYPTPHSISIPY